MRITISQIICFDDSQLDGDDTVTTANATTAVNVVVDIALDGIMVVQ